VASATRWVLQCVCMFEREHDVALWPMQVMSCSHHQAGGKRTKDPFIQMCTTNIHKPNSTNAHNPGINVIHNSELVTLEFGPSPPFPGLSGTFTTFHFAPKAKRQRRATADGGRRPDGLRPKRVEQTRTKSAGASHSRLCVSAGRGRCVPTPLSPVAAGTAGEVPLSVGPERAL
jgi:hypothetical protein